MISLQTVKNKINDLRDFYAPIDSYGVPRQGSIVDLAKKWHQELQYDDEQGFNEACYRYMQENNTKMPTVLDIKKRMNVNRRVVSQSSYDLSQLKNFVCQHDIHFSNLYIDQTREEASMCEQASEQAMLDKLNEVDKENWGGLEIIRWKERTFKTMKDDAEFSKNRHGVVLCHWHYNLWVAKKHEHSYEATNCADRVKWLKKST